MKAEGFEEQLFGIVDSLTDMSEQLWSAERPSKYPDKYVELDLTDGTFRIYKFSTPEGDVELEQTFAVRATLEPLDA